MVFHFHFPPPSVIAAVFSLPCAWQRPPLQAPLTGTSSFAQTVVFQSRALCFLQPRRALTSLLSFSSSFAFSSPLLHLQCTNIRLYHMWLVKRSSAVKRRSTEGTVPDGGLSPGRGMVFPLLVLGKIPGFLGASSGGLFSICVKD